MPSARTPLAWRSLAAWLVLGGVLGCLLGGVMLLGLRLSAVASPSAEAGLTVIPLPTETSTPTPSPTLLPTAQQATDLPAGIPSGGPVAGGMLVEVIGTGTDGLRLRAAPGLQSATNMVAVENEVFEVRDGPTEADGRTWWYLVNPYDNSLYGWGVQDFLQPAGE